MNIFAGNLAPDVTEDDLRGLFRQYGEVKFVNIVRDRVKRASAGFGFVEMAQDMEAQAAIQALHGRQVKGQPIKVNSAQPIQL